MHRVLFILIIGIFSGCAPTPRGFVSLVPHTSTRLLPFGGTVLDERTRAPIVGAKVFLSQHPKVACKTDDRGHFQFKEIHNWHYGSISGPGGGEDLPAGEHWRYDVTVSHTNYISRHVGFYYGSDDVVLLKKLGEPSETRPSVLFNGSGHILKDMGDGPYLKRDGIRIVAYNGDVPDTGPWKIHVEFGQRVYDPQVTPVNSPDRASVALSLRTGLDWEFMIKYDWDPVAQSSVAKVKDSSRVYRLTFTP